jgi:hypothetical protein
MRSTEKALIYTAILGVMVLMAISEETRNGGTPAQWAIFWIIVSLLGFGILRNVGAPEVQPRRTKKHHRRVTRRDIKEYRRGR